MSWRRAANDRAGVTAHAEVVGEAVYPAAWLPQAGGASLGHLDRGKIDTIVIGGQATIFGQLDAG